MGYIHVADVDAAVRAIEGAGGNCLMPARDVEMARDLVSVGTDDRDRGLRIGVGEDDTSRWGLRDHD